jgi:two-component system nitrate/nitrite response regulator NarL
VRVTVVPNPAAAVAFVAANPVDRVVLSVLFPDGAGQAAIRRIRRDHPRVLVFGIGADQAEDTRSLDVHGLLTKSRPLAELVQAVSGSRPAPHRTTPMSVSGTRRRVYSARVASTPLAAQFLTGREREVLRLLVLARPTDRIAAELGISVATARGYVQGILSKLDVHSRVQAVSYAVRHSVVS